MYWRLENLLHNLECWKYKRKYPNWNDVNWSGSYEIIYGNVDCNIYAMNNFEILYDHAKKKFHFWIETAFVFKNEQDECDYLKEQLEVFTKYMDDNKLSKDYKTGLFFDHPKVEMEAGSIEELYYNFKLFMKGFCEVRNG